MRRPSAATSRRAGRPLSWAAVAVAILAGAAVLVVLATAPASAHNALRSSTPAADAQVDRSPAEIVLTFDQAALAMGTQVIVTGPSGPVQDGSPRLVDNTVTQRLLPGAPPGRYTVDWRVTSADGHPISGSFGFSSRAAGPASNGSAVTPVATPSEESGESPGIWLIAGAGAGVAVLLAALVLRWVRERGSAPPSPPDPNPNPTEPAEAQEKEA